MSDYRAKTGLNVALVSLTTLNPQPRSEGVKATQRLMTLNGTPYDYGLYVELIWDFLESPAQVLTVYTVFGLHNAKSAAVTIYTPNDLYVPTRYNGKAIRPQPSWQNYYPRGVVIVVRDLEVIP